MTLFKRTQHTTHTHTTQTQHTHTQHTYHTHTHTPQRHTHKTTQTHPHTHTHHTHSHTTHTHTTHIHTNTHTHKHTHTHTPGRTLLNNESARRRVHYLHNKETSISTSGFEPVIPALERLQTYALKRTATAIGPRYSESKRYRNEKCGKDYTSTELDVSVFTVMSQLLLRFAIGYQTAPPMKPGLAPSPVHLNSVSVHIGLRVTSRFLQLIAWPH